MTREDEVIEECRTIVRLATALGAAVERLAGALERWNAPTNDAEDRPTPRRRLQ
jgi:hypothetical protein